MYKEESCGGVSYHVSENKFDQGLTGKENIAKQKPNKIHTSSYDMSQNKALMNAMRLTYTYENLHAYLLRTFLGVYHTYVACACIHACMRTCIHTC